MITDWPVTRQWASYNQKLTAMMRAKLGNAKWSESWLMGGTLAQSVWEVVVGLARLFPHRRRIIYFKNQDPVHEPALNILAKEGFEILSLKLDKFSVNENWQSEINDETLLVLYSGDDPFLGLKHICSGLEESTQAKRAFSVKIIHQLHRCYSPQVLPTPYSLEIWGYGKELSCIRLGERAKLKGIVSPLMNWGEWQWESLVQNLKSVDPGNEVRVRTFEEKRLGGAQPLLDPHQARNFDRAVVFWEDMDGHAFIHYLAEELGTVLKPAGEETRFETTSLSRWGGVRTMDWLHSFGFRESQIRGSVILHHSQLNEKLERAFLQVREKVLRLQNPDI